MPPKGFQRLIPGGEVRLRGVGIVALRRASIKDDDGRDRRVHCTLDPESRPAWTAPNRKVKGTIHWVSARHAVPAEVRLYDRLFTVPRSGRRATARRTSTSSIRIPSAS